MQLYILFSKLISPKQRKYKTKNYPNCPPYTHFPLGHDIYFFLFLLCLIHPTTHSIPLPSSLLLLPPPSFVPLSLTSFLFLSLSLSFAHPYVLSSSLLFLAYTSSISPYSSLLLYSQFSTLYLSVSIALQHPSAHTVLLSLPPFHRNVPPHPLIPPTSSSPVVPTWVTNVQPRTLLAPPRSVRSPSVSAAPPVTRSSLPLHAYPLPHDHRPHPPHNNPYINHHHHHFHNLQPLIFLPLHFSPPPQPLLHYRPPRPDRLVCHASTVTVPQLLPPTVNSYIALTNCPPLSSSLLSRTSSPAFNNLPPSRPRKSVALNVSAFPHIMSPLIILLLLPCNRMSCRLHGEKSLWFGFLSFCFVDSTTLCWTSDRLRSRFVCDCLCVC